MHELISQVKQHSNAFLRIGKEMMYAGDLDDHWIAKLDFQERFGLFVLGQDAAGRAWVGSSFVPLCPLFLLCTLLTVVA